MPAILLALPIHPSVSCLSKPCETPSNICWGPLQQIHEMWGVDESFRTLVQIPPLVEDIECTEVVKQKLELQVPLMFDLHPPFRILCARTHLMIQCSIALEVQLEKYLLHFPMCWPLFLILDCSV